MSTTSTQTTSIPLPDAAGYWHFTYVTTDIDGAWYGGKRSTNKHPDVDRYIGSGNWIKHHPQRSRLQRKILSFYENSALVYLAEAELVTCTVVLDDPLCMNERPGGEGMTMEYALRQEADPTFQTARKLGMVRRSANPEWQKANAARAAYMHTDPAFQKALAAGIARRSADPRWKEFHASHLKRMHSDPKWQAANKEALKRLHADPPAQASHAAAMRAMTDDPKWKAAQALLMRSVHAQPGYKEAHAAAMKQVYANPEWRVKLRAARARHTAAKRQLAF